MGKSASNGHSKSLVRGIDSTLNSPNTVAEQLPEYTGLLSAKFQHSLEDPDADAGEFCLNMELDERNRSQLLWEVLVKFDECVLVEAHYDEIEPTDDWWNANFCRHLLGDPVIDECTEEQLMIDCPNRLITVYAHALQIKRYQEALSELVLDGEDQAVIDSIDRKHMRLQREFDNRLNSGFTSKPITMHWDSVTVYSIEVPSNSVGLY